VIIATASIKGGTGKSAACIMLARQYTEAGRRVLVIDLDPQASSTDYFLREGDPGEIAEACSYHLLTERAGMTGTVRHGAHGVDIVPAAPKLAGADVELAADPGAVIRLRGTVSGAGYDIILIDTAPALSAPTRAALYTADVVLVPVQPDRWVLQGLEMLTAAALKIPATTGRGLTVLCLPTMCNERDSTLVRAILEGRHGCTLAQIPRAASMRRVLTGGKRPAGVIAEAFAALADELEGDHDTV
jgi:chromosome partitioning protein